MQPSSFAKTTSKYNPHEVWFNFGLADQFHSTDEVVFEAFESSATVAAVLNTKYALQWRFPSRCVAIPASEFRNTSFQDALATFLEQATEVAFDQFAARAKKGDKLVVESRDTPSPALILEMLMSFLEAMGRAALFTPSTNASETTSCWAAQNHLGGAPPTGWQCECLSSASY